ncbi:MAG: murein biosynthesis integral membrane protein MurJ [Myxococcales bacterium]
MTETATASDGQRERQSLVARASVVGAGTLLSRVLGLLRDMTLAALFSRAATDAFFVAFTIPNALRQLLGEGAVSSAVVPVLTGKLATENEDSAKYFFARIRAVSLAALVTVAALGMLFAEPLTELFASGHHARPGDFERTVSMTRWVFPYIVFAGTAALGMAALHAKRRFAVAAFAPGLLNVGFLGAALLLPPVLLARGMDPAHALWIGALVGGVLQVAAQVPALRAIGYAGRPVWDPWDPGVRVVFRRIAPLTFGIGVYYVDLVLSRRFLSELGTGAQSYFSWASRLCDFPQGIFVMALSTAALPGLSSLAARGDREELTKTWAHGMGLALFVAIPASVAMAVLREPLVAALFQRGEFDALAVRETARALLWQGGAIWTVSVVRQILPLFYAVGDTRTPVLVSVVDLAAFVVLAVVLRGPMGHAGVSAAVAGSSTVQMVLLIVGARWRVGPLRGGELAKSAARTLGASAVAALGAWGASQLAGGGVLAALVGGLVFVTLFGVAAWGLGAPELSTLFGGVRRRLQHR